MLDNPISRESMKAAATTIASLHPTPLTTVMAATLGIAVEALGYLSDKRTKELFNTSEFLQKVVDEIQKSDDFASFVYDVWMRHNFESSEIRRKRLKAILENAVAAQEHDFENFTRILAVSQQITSRQAKWLEAFYGEEAHKLSDHPRSRYDYELNAIQALTLLERVEPDMPHNIPELNQLCNLGLLGTYTTFDGECYKPVRFGLVFLEYIKT